MLIKQNGQHTMRPLWRTNAASKTSGFGGLLERMLLGRKIWLVQEGVLILIRGCAHAIEGCEKG